MKLWIGRDRAGILKLYDNKPKFDKRKQEIMFIGGYYEINSNLFPEVTFENSPQMVELKLMHEIVGVAESPLKTFPRVNEFEVGPSYRR